MRFRGSKVEKPGTACLPELQPGDPKVDDLHKTVFPGEQVRRSDSAVDDALAVCVVEGVSRLADCGEREPVRERTALP
jgi:hypothetical protein